MELSGLICLSLQVLLEDDKDKLQRFISKTSYGAAFYNNPKLRDGDFALFRTETPTVTAMIAALDNFVQANSYSDEKDIYKHNYAFLCQFSHPSQDSSALFVDAIEEIEGHVMQFRWAPDFGVTGIISTLELLKQSLQIGLAAYYLFSAYDYTKDTININESNIETSYKIFTGKDPRE